MKIIGLCGKKGAGKDTFADTVVENDKRWIKTAFAAPLKEAAKIIFQLSEEQVNGTLKDKETVDPRWGKSPRQILQMLGTEGVRQIDKDTWVKNLKARIESMERETAFTGQPVQGVFITDVRFPNEVEAIKSLGGEVIRVNRESHNTGHAEGHASEKHASTLDVNWEIENTGNLTEFRERVLDFFKKKG